jgi:3-hydroxyisobutyrate dehydrogenase-like beta-hydroxyacid dehydrogenase
VLIMKIGFLGLGKMGAGIAANLLKSGHEVVVWNRSAAKAQPLIDLGARPAATPRQAAAEREVVVTMLADDAALQAVSYGTDGLMAGLGPQGLHVSMSTIAVATADQLKRDHAARGQRFLSAPVFGRPEAAAAAKLFVVAAGEDADLEAAAPVFSAVSQRVFKLGANPAAANLVKLCGNFMILAAVEAMGEAMTLAEKGGVRRSQLLEVLTGSLFDVPLYRNYGAMLAEQRFVPAGFAASLGLKDMRLTAQAADSLRVPMPLLSVLRDHLLQTIANEGEDIDWSGIGRTIAKNAGM